MSNKISQNTEIPAEDALINKAGKVYKRHIQTRMAISKCGFQPHF
jgi:hypothetical protein